MDPRETRVLDARRDGDARAAAEACFRAYGAELHGWLVALYGRSDAEDIYGTFAESLVRAMRGFRGEASARTFAYSVARNVARRHVRDRARRRQILTPIGHHPSALEYAAGDSPGAPATDVLADLSFAERELLILRVDRGFSFAEIARLFGGEGATHETRARTEARLRKRFQALRARLRARARGGT